MSRLTDWLWGLPFTWQVFIIGIIIIGLSIGLSAAFPVRHSIERGNVMQITCVGEAGTVVYDQEFRRETIWHSWYGEDGQTIPSSSDRFICERKYPEATYGAFR